MFHSNQQSEWHARMWTASCKLVILFTKLLMGLGCHMTALLLPCGAVHNAEHVSCKRCWQSLPGGYTVTVIAIQCNTPCTLAPC
jgi:hypothetical protein